MQFRLEQRFSAPVEAVEAAFLDPRLLAELATLPQLGRPELLLRVRFPLVGGTVERAIVAGLRDHPAAEERVVQAWLDRG